MQAPIARRAVVPMMMVMVPEVVVVVPMMMVVPMSASVASIPVSVEWTA